MTLSRARTLWMSQCGATPSIVARFGLLAALDYLVAEKLLNFAEAAEHHPDFAQELPLFVAQVRRLFARGEIGTYLAELAPRLEAAAEADTFADADADEDALESFPPEDLAARLDRLQAIRQLLEADQLGTS